MGSLAYLFDHPVVAEAKQRTCAVRIEGSCADAHSALKMVKEYFKQPDGFGIRVGDEVSDQAID